MVGANIVHLATFFAGGVASRLLGMVGIAGVSGAARIIGWVGGANTVTGIASRAPGSNGAAAPAVDPVVEPQSGP